MDGARTLAWVAASAADAGGPAARQRVAAELAWQGRASAPLSGSAHVDAPVVVYRYLLDPPCGGAGEEGGDTASGDGAAGVA